MKGQVKRFLNHKGKAYDLDMKNVKEDKIGFFDLVSVFETFFYSLYYSISIYLFMSSGT